MNYSTLYCPKCGNELIFLGGDLNKCQNPYTCPHGRPTIINLKITDIEKMFERIQK